MDSTALVILPSGSTAHIAVDRLSFRKWTGVRPVSDWNGKPVVGPPDRPFSELQILTTCEAQGWEGAWVYRPRKFLRSWEPRAFASVPTKVMVLHDQISSFAGRTGGCWDILCWRDDQVLFIESKWPDLGDELKPPQAEWLQAALSCGLTNSNFRIIECRYV